MSRVTILLLAGFLATCADARPDPGVSPQLNSGITSSNGGGQRALGNQPNIGVTTRTGAAR